MPDYRGKVVQGKIELASNISVRVDEKIGTSGAQEWSGNFSLPAGQSLKPDQCELKLSDGRCGQICIFRLDSGPDRSTIAQFRGVGALRKAS